MTEIARVLEQALGEQVCAFHANTSRSRAKSDAMTASFVRGVLEAAKLAGLASEATQEKVQLFCAVGRPQGALEVLERALTKNWEMQLPKAGVE
jgi:hypothetical protein